MVTSAFVVMGFLGLAFGIGLAYAARVFHVEVDPRVDKVEEVLPGANCGACGQPGCSGYAQAVVDGNAPLTACSPGGPEVAGKIATILGRDAGEFVPMVAVIQCVGGRDEAPVRAEYRGVTSCAATELVAGGDKQCIYGCLGYGDCVAVCSFDAIAMSDNRLPVVFEDVCTACGACVEACPRDLVKLIPKAQKVYLGCANRDKGKDVKAVCSVGCTACAMCSKPKVTPSGAVVMVDNKPAIPADWDDFEVAVGKCPQGAFVVRGPGEARLVAHQEAEAAAAAEKAAAKAAEKAAKEAAAGAEGDPD
jgi:RnfABCDGE-type electron transport complex B subunit